LVTKEIKSLSKSSPKLSAVSITILENERSSALVLAIERNVRIKLAVLFFPEGKNIGEEVRDEEGEGGVELDEEGEVEREGERGVGEFEFERLRSNFPKYFEDKVVLLRKRYPRSCNSFAKVSVVIAFACRVINLMIASPVWQVAINSVGFGGSVRSSLCSFS
jgi:hypothetical protein